MRQLRQILWPMVIWLAVAAIITALVEAPSWSARIFEVMIVDGWITTGVLLSTVMPLPLMAIFVAMLVRSWLLTDALIFVRLVLGGGITVFVYSINVLLEGYYQSARSCHEAAIATECSPPDSFSYPSNHTVIAFGLSAGLAFALPRLAYAVMLLACRRLPRCVGCVSCVVGHADAPIQDGRPVA